MSVINKMLKDLEKRSSPDLETSDTLKQNISWETDYSKKSFNWQFISFGLVVLILSAVVAFLLWDKMQTSQTMGSAQQLNAAQPITNQANLTRPQPVSKKSTQPVSKANNKPPAAAHTNKPQAQTAKQYSSKPVDVDEAEQLVMQPVSPVAKQARPLSREQQAEVQYQKALQLIQFGKTSSAQERLAQAISFYSAHTKARELLAGFYIKEGRFVEAGELLKKGIAAVPEHVLFAKLYARVLLEQNNPKGAISVLEKRAPAIEKESEYHAMLAATYQRVGDHKNAIKTYLKLVKLRPRVGVWWLGLAISLEKSGSNSEAVDAYKRAQETGNLTASLNKFTSNRVAALQEAGLQ